MHVGLGLSLSRGQGGEGLELGPELLVNSGFDHPSDGWTLGGGWVMGAPALPSLLWTFGDTETSVSQQIAGLSIGTDYLVSATGQFGADLDLKGNGAVFATFSGSTIVTKSYIWTCDSATLNVVLDPQASASGSFVEVSVREIL